MANNMIGPQSSENSLWEFMYGFLPPLPENQQQVSALAAVQQPLEQPPQLTAAQEPVIAETQQETEDGLHDLVNHLLPITNEAERKQALEAFAASLPAQIPADARFRFDTKLLAIITGDKVISSTNLEGYSSEKALAFILDAMGKSPEFAERVPGWKTLNVDLGKLKKLMEMLSRNEPKALEHIVETIENLQPGASFLFPGGWNGFPGHFMLYEIQKENNSYTFKIYNTGAGIDYHTIYTKEKEQYFPCRAIEAIDKKEIASPEFWKCAVALTKMKKSSFSQVNDETVYEKLVSMLRGTLRKDNVDSLHAEQAITPQYAGTCSWKAFMAFLKIKIGKRDAKNFILKLKIIALLNFLRVHPHSYSYTEMLLLENAIRSIGKLACTLYFPPKGGALIGKGECDDLLKIYGLLSMAQGKAQECREGFKKIQKPSVSLPNALDYQDAIVQVAADSLKSSPSDSILSMANVFPQKNNALSEDLPSCAVPPPLPAAGNLVESVKAWRTFLSETDFEESQSSGNALEWISGLLENLPIPSAETEFPIQSIHQKKELLEELQKIAWIYFTHASKNPGGSRAGMLVGFLHLYAIYDKLASEMILKSHGVDFRLFRLYVPFRNLLFNEKSPVKFELQKYKDNQRLTALAKYFDARNQAPNSPLFDYPCDGTSTLSFKLTQDNYARIGDFAFIEKYLKLRPEIEERLRREVAGEAPVSPQYLLARVFCQEEKKSILPLEYFGLRNMSLLCRLYLCTCFSHCSYEKRFYSPQSRGGYVIQGDPVDAEISVTFLVGNKVKKRRNPLPLRVQETDYKYQVWSKELLSSFSSTLSGFGSLYEGDPDLDLVFWKRYDQNKARCGAAYKERSPGTRLNVPLFKRDELEKLVEIRNAQELRIPLCLDYYKKNIHLLENPKHWAFLKITLKEYSALPKCLESHKELAHEIKHLLEKALKFYSGDIHRIETTERVLELVFDISGAMPLVSQLELFQQARTIINGLPFDYAHNAQVQLETQLLKVKEKLLQFYDLDHLEPAHAAEILACKAGLKNHGYAIQNANSTRHQKLFEALKQLLNNIGIRNKLLSDAFTKLHPLKKPPALWTGQFPVYKGENWEWNIWSGTLLCDGKAIIKPSRQWQSKYSYLRSFFGGEFPNVLLQKGDILTNAEETLEIKEGRSTIVKVLIDGQWYRYLNRLRGPWYDQLDLNNYTAWALLNPYAESILFKDQKFQTRFVLEATGERPKKSSPGNNEIEWHEEDPSGVCVPPSVVVAETIKNDKMYRLRSVADNLVLHLISEDFADQPQPPLIQQLSSVSSWDALTVWVDSQGTIRKVFLKNLHLNFELVRGEYVCQSLTGCRLVFDQPVSPFIKFKNYLILENAQGERRAIIPHKDFRVDSADSAKDPLNKKIIMSPIGTGGLLPASPFPRTMAVSAGAEAFYQYDMGPGVASLQAHDLTSRLHLASIYWTDNNIEQSVAQLLLCRKDSAYSNAELEKLINFLDRIDLKNLHQLALCMHILWLVIDNQNRTLYRGLNKSDKEKSLLAKVKVSLDSYKKYVTACAAMPPEISLKKEQELEIIAWIQGNVPNLFGEDIVKNRKMKLTGNARADLSINNMVYSHFGVNEPDKYFPAEISPDMFKDHHENAKRLDLSKAVDDETMFCQNLASKRKIAFSTWLLAIWRDLLSDNPDTVMHARRLLAFNTGSSTQAESIHITHVLYKGYLIAKFGKEACSDLQRVVDQYNTFLKDCSADIRKVIESSIYDSHDPNEEQEQALINPKKPVRTLACINYAPDAVDPKPMDALPENCIQRVDQLLVKRLNLAAGFFEVKPEDLLNNWKMPPISDDNVLGMELQRSPLAMQLYTSLIGMASKRSSGRKVEVSNGDYRTTLAALDQNLKRYREEAKHHFDRLKERTLKLANYTALEAQKPLTVGELQQALQKKMEVVACKKKEAALEDLALAFLSGIGVAFNRTFSDPSEVDQKELQQIAISAMMMHVELVHVDKMLQLTAQMLKSSSSSTSCVDMEQPHLQKLLDMAATQRAYPVESDSRFLAFEFLTGLYLRPRQVEMIRQTMADPQKSLLLELMMGEGKTKVIIPLLAHFIAAMGQVPFIVVPQAMFNQNLKDLKLTSEQILKQAVHTLDFDRSSYTGLKELKDLLIKLQDIKTSQGCVITTPETLQALVLKFQELACLEATHQEAKATEKAKSLTTRRKALADIFTFLKAHAAGIGDEAHVLYNSLNELNYTLDPSTPYNKLEVATVVGIFDLLVRYNVNLARPIDPNDQTAWSNLRRMLVESIYPGPGHEQTRAYVLGWDMDTHHIEQIYLINPSLANEAAFIKEQLWTFLPHTLSKGLNLHYGRSLHPDLEIAVPYVGNNKPSANSEFGHPHIILNFTIQMMLQEGLTLKQFKEWLTVLKKRWTMEYSHGTPQKANELVSQRLGPEVDVPALSLSDHVAVGKLFLKFYKSTPIIFEYFQDILVPKLKFNPQKLNSNAQDLGTALFARAVLLTGTPYNKETYEEAIAENHVNDLQATEKLIQVLGEPRNQRIHISADESPEDIIAFLSASSAVNPHIRALIDLGAYFRGIKNSVVAKRLLESMPQIQGLIYFDDRLNVTVCLQRGIEEPVPYYDGLLPKENVFCYFDQVHSFGADIPMHALAHGLVTVSHETCYFQLLQAVKRLRQIEFGQCVHYMASKPLIKRISDLTGEAAVEAGSLFAFSILNQTKKLETELVISTKHKLQKIPKKLVFDSHQKSSQTSCAYTKQYVDSSAIEPFQAYRHHEGLVPPSFLFHRMKGQLSVINGEHLNQQNIGKMNAVIQKACAQLPGAIRSRMVDSLNQEVQKQEEKQVQMEVNTTSAQHQPPVEEVEWNPVELPTIDTKESCNVYSQLYDNSSPGVLKTFRLNDVLSCLGSFYIFENNILASRNYLLTVADKPLSWETKFKPADFFVQHIAQNGSGISFTYLLVSIKEAEKIYQFLKSGMFTYNSMLLTLYNLEGKCMAANHSMPSEWVEQSRISLNQTRVQLMFFDGEEYYPEELVPYVRQWCAGREEILLKLYAQIHANRMRKDEYGNGNLFAILHKRFEALPQGQDGNARQNFDINMNDVHKRKRPFVAEEVEEEEAVENEQQG